MLIQLYQYEKLNLHYRSYPGYQLATWGLCIQYWRRGYSHHHCDSSNFINTKPFKRARGQVWPPMVVGYI